MPRYYRLLLIFCSILCSCILPSIYAMHDKSENTSSNNIITTISQDKANNALLEAIITAANKKYLLEEDWKTIETCFKQGADPNYKIGRDKTTPLMIAASKSKSDLFYYLLEKGAHINVCDSDGWTPLFHALVTLRTNPEKFDIEMVKKMLILGANPNIKTTDQLSITPLVWTIQTGSNSDVLKLLIDYGADASRKSTNDCTPLAWAIIGGHLKAIEILCNKAKAPLVDLALYNCNAFHIAAGLPATAAKLSKKIIEVLITYARFDSQKAIINQEQQKKLIIAILMIKKWSGAHEKKYNLPQEIQDKIISYLPEYFQKPDSTLCCKLLKAGYKPPHLFAQVHKRIAWIEQVLQSKDDDGKTALELLESPEQIQMAAPLLDGSRLKADQRAFIEAYPNLSSVPKNNLMYQMYNNCALLLEEQSKNLYS